MNLYRLDPAELTDPLWRTLRTNERGPGAIRAAQARAERIGADVTVSRIDGRTLRVAPIYVCHADGPATLVRS